MPPKLPPLKLGEVKGGGILRRIKLADLLASSGGGSRAVVKLSHLDSVGDALRVLAEHHILSAPGELSGQHSAAQPLTAPRSCHQAHV